MKVLDIYFRLKHKDHRGYLKYVLSSSKWHKKDDEYEVVFGRNIKRYLPNNVPDFDIVALSIRKGDTKWVARFIKDKRTVRRYININTPIEIKKENNDIVADYRDLIVDVIVDKKGISVLDLLELKVAKLSGEDKNIIRKTLEEVGIDDKILEF